MHTNYCTDTYNRRQVKRSTKAELLEWISDELQSRRLSSNDLRSVIPTLTKNQITDLRAGIDGGIKIDRLELIHATFNPSAANANSSREVAA